MKTGLILEGGAMRGLFSAGVMDAMMEAGIRFDGIIGVSAGAAFGCNYKSGQPGRALRYNMLYCRDHRYCSLRSLLLTGDMFGADFCYHQLPETLDPFDAAAFAADPAAFYLVCTDVDTGQACYRRCDRVDDDCYEWMRASASMPLVSRIVEVGGGRYLDGAIADSIPLRFFEGLGYDRNVVVLTQPAGYRKTPPSAMPLVKFFLRRYPALIRAWETRHIRYNETVQYVEEQAARGNVLLIRPEAPLPIGRISHDPEAIARTWSIGAQMGTALRPALQNFLAQ